MGRLTRHMGLSLLTAAATVLLAPPVHAARPADIEDVSTAIPDIAVDMRYATAHNFIGRPIPGYEAPRCLLTRAAIRGLARVQDVLRDAALALKVYDCYRPQTAVDYFVSWSRDLDDQIMKTEFYPTVDKAALFRDGYIAARSSHSRGSTVDLTIVPAPAPLPPAVSAGTPLKSCENPRNDRFPDASIDMGTGYDCFSLLAHTMSPDVSAQQRANRLLLKSLMEANGFRNLPEEWWHFTLVDEPYPDAYFTFPVGPR